MCFAFWIVFYVGTMIHEMGHYLAVKFFTDLKATDFQILGLWKFRIREADPSITLSVIAFHGRVAVSGDPDQPQPPQDKVNCLSSNGKDRLVFMLGGPFAHASMSIALICVCLKLQTGPTYSGIEFTWYLLGWLQLARAIGNLVPGKISDGGHILRVLCRKPIDADLWVFHPVALWSGRALVLIACFFGILQWPGFSKIM
jgi:membrane-associated protease RseP (regulator of RpoE activity)